MRYRVLGQLASGGFSEIFEVEDPASALPERLVLKRLNAAMSRRPEVRAAFAEEAKILRDLKHPNVVTFRRCYFDDEQRVCLLMEQVAGRPLDAWVRDRAGEPEIVLDLFARVLAAVDYLHYRGSPFLHLDLKPDNVLVTDSAEGPQPVLIDFGIARRSGARGLKAYTPPYGAPEQQAGGRLDCATDVYALGQILGEVLQALGGAECDLAAVAAKAKSPSQSRRYADAGEMSIAFRRARAAARAAPARPASSGSWTARTWRPAVLAGAALVGAVIVVALVLRGQPGPLGGDGPRGPEGRVQEPRNTADATFRALVVQADEALRDGQLQQATERYELARQTAALATPGSAAAHGMDQRLRELQSRIDLMLAGGPGADAVRLDLEDTLRKEKEAR